MIFFPVDSGTNDDCLLCHPGYTREELAVIKPTQFIHESTGVPIDPNFKKTPRISRIQNP
jgi:hypothetical protein